MSAPVDAPAATPARAGVNGPPVREAFLGGFWILLADSLFIPTSLIIAAYLARRLGPADYGLYVLAAAIGGWLEWGLSSVVSRAAVKQIAGAADWRPPATATIRLLLGMSLVISVVLWLAAGPVAAAMGASSLTRLLRITALGLPLVGLVLAHRFVLVGRGHFEQRAVAGAVRWVSRLLLVILLIEAGFGAPGAIAAAMGAAAFELAAARWFVRPPFRSVQPTPWREITVMAAPLLATGISMRLFERLDLVCLQAVGERTIDTGLFGAAQNLSMLPGFIVGAFTPVLLASITRQLTAGNDAGAADLARHALRAALWLVLPATVLAAVARPMVQLLFGSAYVGASPLLAILSIAGAGQALIAVSFTLLIAVDRVKRSVAIAVPLVLVALAAHLLVIPRFGSIGAAAVTAVASWGAAAVALIVLNRSAAIVLPVSSLVRVPALAALAAALTAIVPGEGALLVPRLAFVGAVIGGAAVVSGEVNLLALRSLLPESRRTTRL